MANLDNVTSPFKRAICSILVTDGSANSITLTLENSYITWSQPGRSYVAVKPRGRHQSTPVVVETDDGACAGQIVLQISSYKGSSNVHPYEAFTFSGNASGWTTTGVGSRKMLTLAVTENSTVDGGGSQTGTFSHCIITNVEAGEADGLRTMTVSFESQSNAPTWA